MKHNVACNLQNKCYRSYKKIKAANRQPPNPGSTVITRTISMPLSVSNVFTGVRGFIATPTCRTKHDQSLYIQASLILL